MNRTSSFALFAASCIVLITWAGEPKAKTKDRMATLERELRQADTDFARQTAARRLEGWMDSFAADASTIQNGKAITGTPELRKYYEPVFANHDFSLTWTPVHAEAAQDGTLGYTYGAYEAKNGANATHGMYVTVWRRENGRWRVALDLGSAARPQP